jgi:hypothetical protein
MKPKPKFEHKRHKEKAYAAKELAESFDWIVLTPRQYEKFCHYQHRAAGEWHRMRRAMGLPTVRSRDPVTGELEP